MSERWDKDKTIRFCLLFVSLHCADKKMAKRALKLAEKLRSAMGVTHDQ